MGICNGLGDWLACLECPDICTKMCPIENENVIEELRKTLQMLNNPAEPGSAFFDGSSGLQR